MLLSKLTICLRLQPGSLWNKTNVLWEINHSIVGNQSFKTGFHLAMSKKKLDKRGWRWKGDVGESYQVESVVAFQSAVHLVLPHRKRVGKSHQSVTWFQLSAKHASRLFCWIAAHTPQKILILLAENPQIVLFYTLSKMEVWSSEFWPDEDKWVQRKKLYKRGKIRRN